MDYIPATISGKVDWSTNFSTLITAAPTDYGLTAGDATTISDAVDPFVAAVGISTDPSTRTPSAVANTSALQAVMLATVRPFAQAIKINPSVTNEQRSDLGLTIDTYPPTPVPPPTTNPVLTSIQGTPGIQKIQVRDATTPTLKARPYGVAGADIWVVTGIAPAVDVGQATFRFRSTKTPFNLPHAPEDAGKTATVWARWVNFGGPGGIAAVGPWSPPLSYICA